MSQKPSTLFLDDDHVLRILRLILCDGEDDPRVRNFFAPENVDLSALVHAAKGLRRSDGAAVTLAGEEDDAASDATMIVFRRGQVTEDLLGAHPRLKLIQRFGERTDGIDLAAAAARGVWVSCFPRRTPHLAAEHALLLMLALGKRLLPADKALREGRYSLPGRAAVDGVCYNWVGIEGPTGLFGRTIGIVGFGEIGVLVAKMARAFGMNVLYFSRHRATHQQELVSGAQYTQLSDLLERSDFVSVHANLPGNAELANRAFFAGMKPSAFFVNTSRGQLVDEDALFDALASGTIAGAGLDVHAPEPRPAFDRFAALPNVVLTPHIAGGVRSGVLEEFETIVRNCCAAMKGEPPLYAVRMQGGAK
jgi:phosphoglycerate dehydrogenase-like enzyme